MCLGDPASGSSTFFFWKGRVALYAILKALGIGAGDQVLVPGYTCVVVPAAVQFAGAEPLYVDIDPSTYNLSLEGIKTTLGRANTDRIKAIVVQHTYGLPADTASIAAWAEQRSITVIEDCCHVLGSRYRDCHGAWREVGTLGDASFFSSQWSKPVSTGLGGWAKTSDPGLADAIDAVSRSECVRPSFLESTLLALQMVGRGALSSSRCYWTALGLYRFLSGVGLCIGSSVEAELRGQMPVRYAKRMSALQRRVLRWRMAHVRSVVEHRRHLKQAYDTCLLARGLPVLNIPPYAEPVLLRYPVRVSNKSEVLKQARTQRVEIGDWFDHPLHPKEADAAAFGYQRGMLPYGERAAREVINMPMHGHVTPKIASAVVDFVARVADSERFAVNGYLQPERST